MSAVPFAGVPPTSPWLRFFSRPSAAAIAARASFVSGVPPSINARSLPAPRSWSCHASLLEIDPVEPYPVELDSAEPEPVEPPRTPPLPRLVEPPPSPCQPLRFTRPRSVLILESDPSIRKLLRRLLDRRGYFTREVVEPEDLAGRVARAARGLADQSTALLGANGLDAVLALADVHPNLKILALSRESLNGAEIPGRCVALTKPFSIGKLFSNASDRLLESAISRIAKSEL